jgi:hypothetical protein
MLAEFSIPNGYVVRVWESGVYVRDDAGLPVRVDYHVRPEAGVIDIGYVPILAERMEIIARAVCEACAGGGRMVPVIGNIDAN